MTQKIIIEQDGKAIIATYGDKFVRVEYPSEEDFNFKNGAEEALHKLVELIKTSEDRVKEFADAMFNDHSKWNY